eukprot:TRINITY_DN2174_c1_g1_i1.p1 TRINITY_DN2174_c1_g1~~TRINITY_DN2174_c1_g1_i1.p1  ORF type:complete len:179 (+),score=43.66 TRINITY_DN2174_c1_g1_i1:74-610(+)
MSFAEQIRMESEMDWSEQIDVQREQVRTVGGVEPSLNLCMMLINQGKPDGVDEALQTLERLIPKLARLISEECADKLRVPANSPQEVDPKADNQLLQCLYFVSLANYKQGSFEKCIASCDKLLRLLPTHHQATGLKSLAEEGLEKQQIKEGAQLATGLLLTGLGALGIGLLLKGKKSL